jgi:GntR family transcriptional repressor for pyruvate dehydrogenase complex
LTILIILSVVMPRTSQSELGWLEPAVVGNVEVPKGQTEPRGRISDFIAERIRTAVSDGILAPGSRLLSERELAQRLKASRESVREAYRSLEVTGLLVIRRGKEGGAFVRDMDHGAVTRSLSMLLRLGKTTHRELTEARLLIEPPIARLAARRATQSDVEAMGELIEHHAEAIRRNEDPRRYDLQFHRIMAKCAKNLPLTILMNSLADLMVEALSGVNIPRETRARTVEFHRLVFEAISRKDENRAFKLMQQHIGDVQRRLKKPWGLGKAKKRTTSRSKK